MMEVYFNWEPTEHSGVGSKVVSRLIVGGRPMEYPKAEIIRVGEQGSEDCAFCCTFWPVENEAYYIAMNDWAFTHQTLMMWVMQIVNSDAYENSGEESQDPPSLEGINIAELLEHLEESLKQEDTHQMNISKFQTHYVMVGKTISATLKTLNPFEATEEEREGLMSNLTEMMLMLATAGEVADVLAKFVSAPADNPPEEDTGVHPLTNPDE